MSGEYQVLFEISFRLLSCMHHSLKKHIKMKEMSRCGRYVWPEGKCHLALMFRISVKQRVLEVNVVTGKIVMHFKRKSKSKRLQIFFCFVLNTVYIF